MAKGDKLYYKALHLAEQEDYNYKDVLHLLNESIRLGNKKTSYALATWYLNGFNVRKDYKKGFSLLQNAIQGGRKIILYCMRTLCWILRFVMNWAMGFKKTNRKHIIIIYWQP